MSNGTRHVLQFISGKYRGGEFPLSPDKPIVVGRGSDLDMVLVEDMVSRRHSRISHDGTNYVIEDLGSTNGTFVNGERVQRRALQPGDRVLIGTSILKLEARDADSPARAAPAAATAGIADPVAPATGARPATAAANKLKANETVIPTGAASKPGAQSSPVAQSAPVAAAPRRGDAPSDFLDDADLMEDEGEDLLGGVAPAASPAAPVAVRGAEPPRAATSTPDGSVTMSGNIGEIPLPDLLQLLGSSKKTGVLHVHGPSRVGIVTLDRGIVQMAEIIGSSEADPRVRAYEIINWSDGTFELRHPNPMPHFSNAIKEPVSELLMEAMKYRDELAHFAKLIPDEDAPIEIHRPIGTRLSELSAPELDMLELALNAGTARAVCEISSRPRNELYKALAELARQKVIRFKL